MIKVMAIKLTEKDLVEAAILLAKERNIPLPENVEGWKLLWLDDNLCTIIVGDDEVKE